MRNLNDNALSHRLAEGLNLAGHDAVHLRALGLATADDELVFSRAVDDDRILVSEDTDFGTILALRQSTVQSVILFRQEANSAEKLLAALLSNLTSIKDDLAAGAVVVFEDKRIRIRRLPI